jgi:hypothetical protein
MKFRLAAPVAAALVAGAVAFAFSARAEDPAHGGMPPVQKKITNPLLTGVVGEWNVAYTMQDPSGPKSGKATSKISLAVGDTVLIEHYDGDLMGEFHGLGVVKVSDDGKTMTNWWFDTFSAEPIKLSGPLTDAQSTIEGDCPGMGHMKIVWKKVDGGFDFDGTLDGHPWLSQQYRKK